VQQQYHQHHKWLEWQLRYLLSRVVPDHSDVQANFCSLRDQLYLQDLHELEHAVGNQVRACASLLCVILPASHLQLRGVKAQKCKIMDGIIIYRIHGELLPVQEDSICNDWACT
jgi:hypothetical protein